jgi:hypothetical protein
MKTDLHFRLLKQTIIIMAAAMRSRATTLMTAATITTALFFFLPLPDLSRKNIYIENANRL